MSLRDRAIQIIDGYAAAHSGTAVVVGFCGGQFGADRIALSALTRAMILEICDLYGEYDYSARTIHVAAALARLTLKGTAIAHTILNWLPGGSLVNGATTYFLTRSAGLKCIEEIERGLMNTKDQLKIGARDVTIALITSGNEFCNVEGIEHNYISDVVNDTFGHIDFLSKAGDYGLTSVVDTIKELPEGTFEGVNKFIYISLKQALVSSLSNNFKGDINWKTVLRSAILGAMIEGMTEHNKISSDELLFRLQQKNKLFPETFDTFIDSISQRYDKLEKERGSVEAMKDITSFISDFIKVKTNLTIRENGPTKAIKIDESKIFDNEYDKKVKWAYEYFLSECENENIYELIWYKCSCIYQANIRLNKEYNCPQGKEDPFDDVLIHHIATEVKKRIKILQTSSVDEIAYYISLYMKRH